MARDWDATFNSWARPPSKTEEERIENTVRAIRKAMDGDPKLSPLTKVYVQGSYRNRVNVRRDSDVDVGVLYVGKSFGTHYPPGVSDSSTGNIPATYTYDQFKNDVGNALVNHFGADAVHRGNKAFDVHENTYRVDADIVPVFIHRRYLSSKEYICGVQLHPDNGGTIVNWPERLFDNHHWPRQHYENGVAKNTATGRAFKGVVRILKKLRNEMEDNRVDAASPISGFLIECLVWNAPNECFGHGGWYDNVQAVFRYLWSNLDSDNKCSEWGEVSELKYLFKGSPPSKRQQAYAFVDAAWSYVGVG